MIGHQRMFQLKIPEIEYYDEQKSMFVTYQSLELNLEHSLVSYLIYGVNSQSSSITAGNR